MFFEFKENNKRGARLNNASLELEEFCGFRGRLLKNICLETGRGKKTKVDLIFITAKGIFVIKNTMHRGYITGSEKWEKWEECVFAGKDRSGKNKVEKLEFYDPIWQNTTDIKSLKKYLGEEDVPFFSVVAFGGRCMLKDVQYDSANVAVCMKNDMTEGIKKLWESFPDALKESDIKDLYDIFYPIANPDMPEEIKEFSPRRKKNPEGRENKINERDAKGRRAERNDNKKSSPYNKKTGKAGFKDNKNPGLCPKCGGKLVLKRVKNGPDAGKEFYGCFNYPKCRYKTIKK